MPEPSKTTPAGPSDSSAPVDRHGQARLATEEARRRVAAAGFGDLFQNGFVVRSYTGEQLEELRVPFRDWLGFYVSRSIDYADEGLTAALNLDRHEDWYDMADTLAHECGHGLWELLDAESQAAWREAAKHARWGPEERFADDFMFLTGGQRHLMTFPELFDRIVAPDRV